MQNPSRRRIAKFIADQLMSGESVQRVAKVLAAWLVESRQTRTSELVLRDIETALLNDHKFLAADVSSARELSHETIASLREMLAAETGAQKVEIIPQVDENLVGGVIVRTPDAEMDASLRTKLRKLRAI
ncbi:F0F1 ATP synthase subunit delta [Candidatus Saccharibacteria bacterium]|nr:F0F1 ATP synthase subunit delta [Candidatus Saccharibacteria bacterium]